MATDIMDDYLFFNLVVCYIFKIYIKIVGIFIISKN